MAVTPVGNPYVESSDLVANYPGASEALAERIDIVGVNPFANAAARDAAIPSPVQGQMCSLNDDNKGYRYDGSAWVLFSGAGDANFTNAATGTYTDGGISYKYITFTGSGSLVVDRAGFADVLVIGGGGGGSIGVSGSHFGAGGAAGTVSNGLVFLSQSTHTITIGAGGALNAGGFASIIGVLNVILSSSGGGIENVVRLGGINTFFTGGTNAATISGGGGAGNSANGSNAVSGLLGGAGGAGVSSSITGAAVTRGGGGGGGGSTGGAGGSGGAATNGSINLGGGAGGGATVNTSTGGSGLVIVRVVV